MNLSEEQKEAARHALWHVGDPHGVEPGGFTTSLLEAWSRADASNSLRLACAFPELGWAVGILEREGHGALTALIGEQS